MVSKNYYNSFHTTRVVSRDFIKDWFQGIRSLFGLRMKAYENRVQETMDLLMEEIKSKGSIEWHRINIQEVQDGILINIYGKYKEKR